MKYDYTNMHMERTATATIDGNTVILSHNSK